MVYRIQRVLITACNLFFVLMSAALLFFGCGGDTGEAVLKPPEEVKQEISKFSLMQSREGRVKWKLIADTATFLEADRVAIEEVELLIFGDKDGETMTISGDRGEVNERTYNVKITGNVEGISSNGGRLNAEEVFWRDKPGEIYTLPGVEVTITKSKSVLVGEELVADPELETARLKSVTGVIHAEEKESEK